MYTCIFCMQFISGSLGWNICTVNFVLQRFPLYVSSYSTCLHLLKIVAQDWPKVSSVSLLDRRTNQNMFYWDKQQLYLEPPLSLDQLNAPLCFSVFWFHMIYVALLNHLQRCLTWLCCHTAVCQLRWPGFGLGDGIKHLVSYSCWPSIFLSKTTNFALWNLDNFNR